MKLRASMNGHSGWNKEHEKEVEERTAQLDELNRELTDEIARLKEEREALARENQEWVQIFDASSNFIMILDDQHRILRANKAVADALGMTEEEIIGQVCFELIHGEKEPPHFCPHVHLLADGKEHSAEVIEPRLGGTYEVTVFPLLSQDARRSRSVHVARDITEEKRKEHKIHRQAEFLNNVLDSLTHSFYVLDASDFTILVANRNAESGNIKVGQKCYAATHGRTSPCSGPEHPCPVMDVRKTGKPVTVEHIHYDGRGGAQHIEIHAYPIMNAEGEVLQVIEYALDITTRKKTEEALERRVIALTRPLNEIEGIVFEDLFNLDEIQRLQDQFAEAFCVASLITRADGTPITKPSNFCRLCEEIIRKTEKGLMNCHHSDSTIGGYNPDGPTIQPCLSVGLGNAGTSISVGGRHIANWLIGQIRNEMQDESAMRAHARTIGADEDAFMAAYKEVPYMSQEQFNSVAQALHTLAGQLSTMAYQNVQQARFIAERKQAEEALRQSEQRFSLAIEGSRVGIVDWDVPSGKMFWSPRVFTQLGYEPHEFEPTFSLVIEKFIHPDDIDNLLRQILAHHQGNRPAEAECRVITKDGTVKWFRLSGHSSWDEQHQPLRTVGTVEDITERKQAEEARLRSETQYRNLFDESRDGVFFDLREGEITDANPAFCEIFGYTKEELIGKNVRELYVDPVDRSMFQEEIEKIGFVKEYEIRFQKKDGTEVNCLLTASVQFGDDGSIMGYRGIMRDLTIRKRLQNQLFQAQKMEAIGTLAGGIAHDFNNLLQVVLGYADMLIIRKAKESSDLKTLQAIRKAAKDGGELVKGLLTFSRQVESSKVSVDLTQHLTQVRTLLRRIIPKTIETELIFASDLANVNADPVQLDQMLMNLAINAHHAMPRGGKLAIEARNVTLGEDDCRTNVEAKPGEHVLLKISDSGHGMEKDVVDHIFEPFFTTKEAGKGTGLGLAIVYGIVKNHNGHIACSSQPGRGTTFSIFLPAASQKSEIEMATALGEMTASGTETILIVDDEEPIRNAFEIILTDSSYKVFKAENGEQALEIYREKKGEIDLIVLDLNMPGMGGAQCLEAILKIDPEARVIVASGYRAKGTTKGILEAGARGFIGKPFEARQLLQLVRRVLRQPASQVSQVNGSGRDSVGSSEGDRTSAQATNSPSAVSPVHKAPDIQQPLPQLRILAIDDRELYLRMLEAGLAQFGKATLTASSGIEGLRIFQETLVDVVVCDLGMPERDGWDVGKRIKEICEEKEVPKTLFVLLTGEGNVEDLDQDAKQKMADCGVDAIVGKPVDIPDLLKIIERLMIKSSGSED